MTTDLPEDGRPAAPASPTAASAPAYPPGGWTPALSPSTGTAAWAMGFLAFIPIPFFGSIVTGIVMALVGSAQRSKGETARRNGIRAANWGLTYLLLTVVLIGGAFLTVLVATGGQEGPVPAGASALIFTMIALWVFPLQLAHLVITITGTVRASRGAVFENKLALPLLR